MNFASEWFLTFLLNSVWEIAAIFVLASVCERLLSGSSARYRHAVWVGALILSIVLPAATGLLVTWNDMPSLSAIQPTVLTGGATNVPDFGTTAATPVISPILTVSTITALALVGGYLAIVLFRTLRLAVAWMRTKRLVASSDAGDPGTDIADVVGACCAQFGIERVPVVFSKKISTPATVGSRKPVVILPETMRDETDKQLLVAAIGHELVHISRRDYLLNLVYEIAFLPLSFHPAVAFVKRRIDHTRELRCDELVTQQLINADDYARSLIKLARSATVLPRPALTTTVGMGDADNLEVRVMSLIKGSVTGPNATKYIALGALLVALAAGITIGNYGFRIGVAEVSAQEPEKTNTIRMPDGSVTTFKVKSDSDGAARELAEKIRAEDPTLPPDQVKLRVEAELKSRGDRMKVEEDDAMDQAKLAKEAQVPMDQAIQTALIGHPGAVLDSRLVRERGIPMYRIVVLDKNSADGSVTFILVSGQDGQIVKTENGKLRNVIKF